MSRRRITFTFPPPAIPLQKEAHAMSQQPITTRQERIDIACAVGIVAILLLLAGFWLHGVMYAAPAAAAEPPATVATQAAVVAPVADRCEEDEPCWDCATMGNGICGTASDADEGEQLTAAELAELGATMEPCAFDEAAGLACYWDATTRGNKQGDSFIWTGTDLIYAAK